MATSRRSEDIADTSRTSKVAAKKSTKVGAKKSVKAAAKKAAKNSAKVAAKKTVKKSTNAAAKKATKRSTKVAAKRAGKQASKVGAKMAVKAPAGRSRASAGGVGGLLARLEAGLKRRCPGLAAKLIPGASPASLARLRKLAGDGLPESYYKFLEWSDGVRDTAWIDGLIGLSADRAVAIKKMMDGIVDGGHYAAFVADEWWSKGWFTFADDQSGYRSLVIDTRGTFGGQPGQVMTAAAKDSTRVLLAPSFDAWLEIFVEVIENGYFEAEEDGLRFDRRGEQLYARHRGYPRHCEPQTASMVSEPTGEGLTRPTRGAWPPGVPGEARWLVAARGREVNHWCVDQSGATVTTWTGSDPAKLKQTRKKWKDADAAGTALDAALRKQLSAGFVFGGAARRGEPLCALHVGDGSNAAFIDLSPDGRTLAVGTILAEARGARLYLIDIETGRRTVLHDEKVAGDGGQTFIHRVAFGPDGTRLYYQMNAQLCEIAVAGGEPTVLADMAAPSLNPHVTRFGFDRTRERLLYFHKSTIRVRATGGKDLLRIPFLKGGTCEYREAAISPSGKLIALVYRSRGVLYGHEDAKKDKTSEIQIWSVDRGKQLYAVPFKGEEMARGLTISPDDREVIVGDYNEVVARDIRTGAEKWRREAREWAYSPDGTQLAVVRHTIAVELLGAATRRGLFKVHATRPWATPHAEIHSPEVLGFSDDGSKLFMGNGGGRVYVWQVK